MKIDEDFRVALPRRRVLHDLERYGVCLIDVTCLDVKDQHVMRGQLLGDRPARPGIEVMF
jgi:hypothetical protein